MSTWRRKAIEMFPDLREDFQQANSTIYDVFMELLPRCREAHAAGKIDELEKIYSFATWCARQKEKDLWNAAGVSFYEHIVDCREAREEMCRWVEPDIFHRISGLLEWRLGKEKFVELKNTYELKRKKIRS